MDEVDSGIALGEALQTARKKAGLTQQELCSKAGLSYSTLAKIERGAITAPSIFTISRIAQVLGVSLEELIGRAVASPPPIAKKVSKSGIRFVYFDVNGCLVRFYHRAFSGIALESGRPTDVIETAFWHYNDAVCRGEISIEEFNERLGQQFGLDDFDWRRYYQAAIEPIEEMQQLVAWAASLYEVGLLTNIMPGQIDALQAAKLIPNVPYAAIIDSSVVKAIKPEARIFEVATKAADCKPHEILLIDDARPNIMAAERFGWHVLWFDDYRPDESVQRIRDALEPAN